MLSSTSPQYFFFNNITFSAPAAPSLLDATLTAGALPPNAPPGTAGYNVLDLKFGDVVDLVVYNTDTGVHPLHLHGQSFWVMAQGAQNSGPFDPATMPLVATEARDVAAVQAGSYLVIRFQASHPTLWFFHCHIEWHLGEKRREGIFFLRFFKLFLSVEGARKKTKKKTHIALPFSSFPTTTTTPSTKQLMDSLWS